MKKPRKLRPYIEEEHEFKIETHHKFNLKTLDQLKEYLHFYNIFYRISGENKEGGNWKSIPYDPYFLESKSYDFSLTFIIGEVRNTETSFELSPGEDGMLNLKFNPEGKRNIRKRLTQIIKEFFSN